MDRYSNRTIPFGFATSVWAIALRNSLKDHPPVFEGAPFALALIIPADARKDIERAFHHLQKTEQALVDVEMGSEIISERGRRDHADIKLVLRLSVLLLLEKESRSRRRKEEKQCLEASWTHRQVRSLPAHQRRRSGRLAIHTSSLKADDHPPKKSLVDYRSVVSANTLFRAKVEYC